ncbi:MAG: 4Fe-4S cluster-binding domain-containing protein [Oscillospiraceae bacterium]
MKIPSACTLCPRLCRADRNTMPGLCGGGSQVKIARAAPHFWEEPCLSGTRGSGTVFFSGCSLGCSFCQNCAISRGGQGWPVTTKELAGVFLSLETQGVHNLNLVTATHYLPWVAKALTLARRQGLSLPVVWNTGGYETLETVAFLHPYANIYLTDLKFYAPALAARLAKAPNYFAVATAALQAMCEQTGTPRFNGEGILQRGTIVRILVLPGQRQDAKELLYWLARNLPKGAFLLSLMSQYTPPPGQPLPAPLNRRIASFEYNDVVNTAVDLGLTGGFMQQRSSAKEEYTPPFDGTGIPPLLK